MKKYSVGDVVEFSKGNGSYVGIKNYGKIEEITPKGYIVICYDVENDSIEHLYFHEDEIKGVKKC